MKSKLIAGAAVGAAVLVGAAIGQPAWAEEQQIEQPGTQPVMAQAPNPTGDSVQDFSRWQIRVRALGVITDTSAATVNVPAAPALNSPASGLSVTNSVVPELDISYFFTKNLAAELILGVTQHFIAGTGALRGVSVGSTWVLPPTLTLQWHVTELGAFQPYFGVGLNYSVFFSQQASNTTANNGLGVTSLGINNAWGFAAQLGFDYMINRNWGINFDVKKLLLMPTYSATVNNTIPINGTATLNPWLIGAGVTYRF
ncbi:MAG: OmpW family outer membrane protein [Reyranellaceae bacterium]